MMTVYREGPCTIEHDGHTATAEGAIVTPDYIVAYLGKDGILTDWHGRPLGTWRSVASWPTPHSYISSHMHQVEATTDGSTPTVYTGRSGGEGLVYRGRRKARQH
jgi:hypothetical protein